jgi:hypothetical protein
LQLLQLELGRVDLAIQVYAMVQHVDLLFRKGVGVMLNTVEGYDLGFFGCHFVFPFKVLPRTGGSFPLFLLSPF